GRNVVFEVPASPVDRKRLGEKGIGDLLGPGVARVRVLERDVIAVGCDRLDLVLEIAQAAAEEIEAVGGNRAQGGARMKPRAGGGARACPTCRSRSPIRACASVRTGARAARKRGSRHSARAVRSARRYARARRPG